MDISLKNGYRLRGPTNVCQFIIHYYKNLIILKGFPQKFNVNRNLVLFYPQIIFPDINLSAIQEISANV